MHVQLWVLSRDMNTNLIIIAATLSDEALLAELKCLAQGSRQKTVELIAHLAVLEVASSIAPKGRVPVRVLHGDPPLLGGGRLQPHQGRESSRRFPGDPRPAHRRVGEPDDRSPPGSAPDDGEPPGHPGRGYGNDGNVRSKGSWPGSPLSPTFRLPSGSCQSRGWPSVPPKPSSPTPRRAKRREAGTRRHSRKRRQSCRPCRRDLRRRRWRRRRHVRSSPRFRHAATGWNSPLGRTPRRNSGGSRTCSAREIPDGDLSAIFVRGLKLQLHEAERKKFAATSTPRQGRGTRPGSRHVPADVQRMVWRRDGGQCAFVAENGRRCAERSYIEFHHLQPYVHQGPATVENISLRCRAHNVYESELIFGPYDPSQVRETRARYGPIRPSTGSGTSNRRLRIGDPAPGGGLTVRASQLLGKHDREHDCG